MKKFAIILMGVLCFVSGYAQEKAEVTIGNGATTRSSRKVSDFTKLSVKGPFDVRLVSGEAGSVSVEADANIIDLVVTRVSNNTLEIMPQEGKLFKSSRGNKIIIKVPFTKLEEVALYGSGSISGKKELKDDIKVVLDGSGKINLEVAAATTSATVLGSGNINLQGTTQNFTCLVSGSGYIKAETLKAGSADVTVSGSGNAYVYTSQAITGMITGSGSVAYAGEPKERDLKRTGSGEFKIFK
ncbi:hypothetical protein CHU92_01895 [Flavobacterium cyanobacteriorum]|uniref:Putative auto-transporter adhesin head GIN domain-containing protein n=1 Tax=Flavobacterium cyanobacteriorum TaxID=2022802 RepID=A0A255ZVN3_9FLAO|nr:head GIN domain-containing protein [Flavobacterium cyanobacteriorum]OYQ45558.1 hypothetical protein CHU92_01895 [Flavobacterium cyanobacteriorum]